MNVISLFDGISCGAIALDRAGIEVDKYYASEIDPYAEIISKKNYPNIIRMGDARKWREWDINWAKIDLLMAGFPCQSWSLAGNRQGDADPRGELMWVMMDILNHIRYYNPQVLFLFENVKTSKEFQAYMEKVIGVKGVCLNSALVSAQNRNRVYFTNIPIVGEPEDRNILLKDIVLEDCQPVALHNLYGGFKESVVRVFTDKSPTIRTSAGGGHIPSFVKKDWLHSEKGGRDHWDCGHHSDIRKDKSACVVANFFKGVPFNVFKDWDCIRKFHPIECERLQTIPENYTEGVSDTQHYKMIGNGWTVDMIAWILKGIK